MRNIAKEKAWAKTKYERVCADIDKKTGIALKAKLKKEKISISAWVTDNAKKYLGQ